MLANVLRAARLSGQEAEVAWSQVAQQARMVGNALAAQLAAQAVARAK